jgi:hypothetical protein
MAQADGSSADGSALLATRYPRFRPPDSVIAQVRFSLIRVPPPQGMIEIPGRDPLVAVQDNVSDHSGRVTWIVSGSITPQKVAHCLVPQWTPWDAFHSLLVRHSVGV